MKRIIFMMISLSIITVSINAYNIGGAYASLLSCDWGQYGYEYGNIGTYKVNGQIYQIYFGSNYCEY